MSKINREKFEAWMTAEQAFHGSDFEWDERRNCYSQFGIHIAYKAFQSASRESEAQLTALTSQLESVVAENAALAAENAGLKAVCEDRRTFIMNGVQLGYIQVPTVETDPALETIRVAVSPQEPTPATDAFLAEVRAQGVEMAANMLNRNHPLMSEAADAIISHAAQLRQEAK